MAKPTLYLESSVIGCLTMWPSRDIVVEGHRQITRRWWEDRRSSYLIFISQVVVDEISMGDPQAASDRLAAVQDIPLLDLNETIIATAAKLVKIHALPEKALQDAMHLALASHHGMDILATWNCTHIANPHILKLVRPFLLAADLPMPEVATPEALFGENDERSVH